MRFSKQRLSAYGLLLINTLVWGAALVIVKPAFEVTTPFRFLFFRFVVAGLLTLPLFIYYLKKLKLSPSLWLKILLIEFLGSAISLNLLYLGLDRTSAIEASLISTTAPVFTVLLGVFLLREKEEKSEWFGLGMSLAGMVLISLLPLISNGQVTKEISLLGNLMIIGANITESLYYVAAKKVYKKLPKLFVATVGFLMGAVIFGVFSLSELSWSVPHLWQISVQELQIMSVLFPVLYMAIFGSIIGLTTYIKGQEKIEISEASVFRYLQPLIYIPLGVMLLKEHVFPGQLLGLLLILVGIFASEKLRKRR